MRFGAGVRSESKLVMSGEPTLDHWLVTLISTVTSIG
jgi:hypothetical protein